jgi:nicotinamide-nucleotide adenylyltransferase
MSRGLFIGRFQPFHLGHMQVIKDMANKVDEMIIGVGSAQHSHTLKDPFTAGERLLMISESLRSEGLGHFYIIPIMDINRYSVWVSHVRSLVPPFDVIFTNNELTSQLFSDAGFRVESSGLYDRNRYSGREIRRRMMAGEPWRDLVPDATAQVIDEAKGESRLRTLTGGGPA